MVFVHLLMSKKKSVICKKHINFNLIASKASIRFQKRFENFPRKLVRWIDKINWKHLINKIPCTLISHELVTRSWQLYFAIPFDCNQLKSRLSNVVTLTGKIWLNAVDTRICNCPKKKYEHHIVGIEKIEIKFGQYQRQMPKHVRFNTIWHYGQQVVTVELHACVRMRVRLLTWCSLVARQREKAKIDWNLEPRFVNHVTCVNHVICVFPTCNCDCSIKKN